MTESLIRELIRFQDLLHDLAPSELWQAWAEANENIVNYLQSEE